MFLNEIVFLATVLRLIEPTSIDLSTLEKDNTISYEAIHNTRGAYVTPMCYTKTKNKQRKTISNPCYVCHTKGKIPNYTNDADLQQTYNFPQEIQKNPFSNLFKDRSTAVANITDRAIVKYIRTSNYFNADGTISLSKALPKNWHGYRPDCYYNFDAKGFDKNPKTGKYTLWRAFRYYPFLGTFWPTNGSTDDVLIRLLPVFAQNESGIIDIKVYALNLSIVEALIKQKNIQLFSSVHEKEYGVDLNQNGVLDNARKIVIAPYDKMSYVGKAKIERLKGNIHLALGLFPTGTEFLHSVRYVDYNESTGHSILSKRMKELRYAKKYTWNTYSQLNRLTLCEQQEQLTKGSDTPTLESFSGNYEQGLQTGTGWKYQGFIEDKKGALRPQTHEETLGCMGCHAGIGATTDSVFAFARKLEGVDKNANDYGWNHWTQKGLTGLKEPQVRYKTFGKQYEYSFYLKNNHSGNAFRNNDEVQTKFFTKDNTIKPAMLNALHNDISVLLFPSKQRALALDKAYKTIVKEQSYIYGKDPTIKPMKNVYTIKLPSGKSTLIPEVIVRSVRD